MKCNDGPQKDVEVCEEYEEQTKMTTMMMQKRRRVVRNL